MKKVQAVKRVNVVIENRTEAGFREKLKELKTEKRFAEMIQFSPEQVQAYEDLSIERGELYVPILYWQEENVVIDGYPSYEIAKNNPDIKFTLVSASFINWEEAVEMVVDINISRPTLNLFQKLELFKKHESYFEQKVKARQNQVCTGPVQSKDKADTLQFIADRVGCGRTNVANFNKIVEKAPDDMLKQCREGEISIYSAHKTLFPVKTKPGKGTGSGKKGKDLQFEMVTEDCNIFDECEKGINVGRKNLNKDNGTPVDPKPIADKMKTDKVVDGRIWIALNRDKTAIQVFKKTTDKDKGVITVQVNCYNSNLISAEDGVVIFEADHINHSTAELLAKDESDFESPIQDS